MKTFDLDQRLAMAQTLNELVFRAYAIERLAKADRHDEDFGIVLLAQDITELADEVREQLEGSSCEADDVQSVTTVSPTKPAADDQPRVFKPDPELALRFDRLYKRSPELGEMFLRFADELADAGKVQP